MSSVSSVSSVPSKSSNHCMIAPVIPQPPADSPRANPFHYAYFTCQTPPRFGNITPYRVQTNLLYSTEYCQSVSKSFGVSFFHSACQTTCQ